MSSKFESSIGKESGDAEMSCDEAVEIEIPSTSQHSRMETQPSTSRNQRVLKNKGLLFSEYFKIIAYVREFFFTH